MADKLNGLRIAILATDGVEQVELTEPRQALEAEGAETQLIAPESDAIQGYNHLDKADRFSVDVPLEQADPLNYDGLLLPGGVANPDRLRTIPAAVRFVESFFKESKPVAAICHAPWLLVEAGVVRDRMLTSWPSLRTDIENAGGQWLDRPAVVDSNLVTSRKPDDIPEFNRKVIEQFDQEARTKPAEERAALRSGARP